MAIDNQARGMAGSVISGLKTPGSGYGDTVARKRLIAEKLARAAARAEVSNPLINNPWTIPATWSAGVAVSRGEVKVTSGGSWYVAASTGTTGATEPTHTNGQTVTDGAVLWGYLGKAKITSSDALAPTITTTGSTPSGLTNYVNIISYPAAFRVLGGYRTTHATSYMIPKTFSWKAASAVCMGCAVGFETDSEKFAVGFTNGSPPPRIIVDGRYLTPSMFILASGTPNWIVVDFSSTTGRARRKVIVETGPNDTGFAGVRVASTDMVWPLTTEETVNAVFISDSILAGSSYGPFLPGGMVHQRVAHGLGWSDPWNFSTGGTGDINTGSSSYYTYGQRIAEALTRNPDIWVFMGSTNDIGQTAGAITTARLAAMQAIRDGGSDAPIINLGVWPLNNAGVATVESAVSDAVDQFNDPYGLTFFIPIYGADPLPWVTGAYNNAANTASNNSNDMIAGDNVHPAEMGTSRLADRIIAAIRSDVIAALAA